MTKKIELGDEVEDLITGFRGVAIAHHHYLHGCDRFTVQPKKLGSDKKPVGLETFDVPQLKLIKKNSFVPVPQPKETPPGGPQHEPAARYVPPR